MMLDAQVLGAPLLDHHGLDLDAAGRVTYLVQQRFRGAVGQVVEVLRRDNLRDLLGGVQLVDVDL